MLYTLNLYSDVCQLFFNKTGKKTDKTLNSKNNNNNKNTVWNDSVVTTDHYCSNFPAKTYIVMR